MATQFGFAMMPLCFASVAGVDLRHDERRVRIHAERGGVVDDHRAGLHGRGRETLGLRATGREQRDVDAREAFVRELTHRDVLAAEFHRLARGARGGQQAQLGQREFALLEALHQFDADGAGRAGDGDDGDLLVANRFCGR